MEAKEQRQEGKRGDGKAEDVEFSMELADEDDMEAWKRGEAADKRAQQS
ncbi:YfhD family protein [Xylanibacillus composti]|uniref:YfhD-like protein n=1 Tax=Xylanibacillus composti TaxID=1572762 RepID=A0A8J4M2I3_9BACL|nr:YfhD family protein [Xylanibacillus composti]MDT9724447.1 YfhD family protein [Xylanibacillus composti]GIQ69709.1 hypothetical protein XYCOK13_25330 [Xylanibacillus composti]